METMTIAEMVKVAKQLDRLDWMINFPDVQCQAITAAVVHGLKKAQLRQVCQGLGIKHAQRTTNASLIFKIMWEG